MVARLGFGRTHDYGIGSAGRGRRHRTSRLSVRGEGRHLAARRSRRAAIHLDSESRAESRRSHTYCSRAAAPRTCRCRKRRRSSTSYQRGLRANIRPRTRDGARRSIRCSRRSSATRSACSMLLLAAVALMLVIASVNVANLMLVRTKAREVELAMRSALGASPGRVIRQILAESMVLAACGGALGLALAAWGVSALVQLAPEGLPRLEEIAVNGRIAVFAVAVTAAVAFGFGLWPAWRASRAPLSDRHSGQRAKHVGPRKPALAVASCVERARHCAGAARRRRVAARQLRAPHLAESRIRSARSRRR